MKLVSQSLQISACFFSSLFPFFFFFLMNVKKIGQIEEFVNAHHVNTSDLLDTEDKRYYVEMARLMAQIHKMKANKNLFNPKQCVVTERVWKEISNAYQIMIERYFTEKHQAHANVGEQSSYMLFQSLKELKDLWNWIVSTLGNLRCRLARDLVFCHNDFHCGNILHLCEDVPSSPDASDEYEHKAKESKRQTHEMLKGQFRVIDYEYAGYTYRCFDIGNFVCELYIDNP
ncbi:hypothetical protein RFI_18272, partial [Reticulomyxa filosa]